MSLAPRGLVLALSTSAALLGACGASAPAADAGIDALSAPDLPRTKTEAELEPQRTSCAFGPGAWPAETIGTEYPIGKDLPFKHVLIVMQENRSFDGYLGRLVAQGYYQAGDFTTPTSSGFQHHDQVDVPPAGWALPDGNGGMVTPHPDTEFCFGVNHGWNDMHQDWNNGANDGFVINNNPNGQRSMSYVDDTIIPFYYALADKFAIGDRYFASVMSSTWPNRLHMMGASSYGVADNSFVKDDTTDHPVRQIFSELDAGNRTWKDYTDGPHQVQFFLHYGFTREALAHNFDVKCDLMTDIANNTLPDVGLIMGNETEETSDEGPSALPGVGGALVEQIIRNLMASPAWKDTVVIVTYDENGGMADHVPPEPACEPDQFTTPHNDQGVAFDGKFDHTGFRVPFIVVSAYSKAHYVSHRVFEHSSLPRFIETVFGLPALSKRDANAGVFLDMFDFANPPYLTPPEITAHTVVDPAVLTSCNQKYAPIGCTP
jgi:phospholipase C